MIDDIVHAVAECGGDACSVQGTALLLHAVSAWRIWPRNENVVELGHPKRKCRNIFFPGRDRGVIGRFFAAIGGVKFFLFLRGPLLRRQIRRRSSFSCFDRGTRMSR